MMRANSALDRLLDALRGHGLDPRQHGSQWECRCPAHDDRRASFGFTQPNGKVLLKCQAGCSTEEIVTALGLGLKDLFDDAEKVRPREVAVYRYTDEAAKPLFEVVRFEPKDFRQRRPDGTWGIKGVRRVIYNLPAVLAVAADGGTVYITEGEKDADRLNRDADLCDGSIIATCNPGGTGGGWRDEYSAFLKGAHVVVAADRDDAGRKHAASVARSVRPHAASLRVVEAAKGKDLFDHLEAGLGLGQLVNITDATEDAAPAGRVIRARTAGSITAADHKPTKWIVPGVAEGRITLVYGPPSGGKTMAAYDLAIAAATGQPQLGKFPFTRPLKVYFIEQELVSDDAWHLADRFARGAGTTLEAIGDHLRIYPKDGFDSSNPADVAALLADMALDPPDLVIVDSVNEVWLGSGDQNVGTDVRSWYHRFPEAIRKAFPTAAILLIHHSTKAAFARIQTSENLAHAAGSVQFIACCDAALYIRADAKTKHHHVVSYERVRGAAVGALVYRLVYDLNRPGGTDSCPMYALYQNDLTDEEATAAVRRPTKEDAVLELLRKRAPERMTKADLMRDADVSKDTVERAVKADPAVRSKESPGHPSVYWMDR